MDFKQLEAFVYVVRSGSFSKAAEKLYLTQPTISAHIGSLEKELGAQLLVRSAKEAYPTQTGSALYEHAVRMLAMRDDALRTCKNSAPDITGAIHIAASTIPYHYVLPKAMAGFRSQYPEVTFQVYGLDSAAVVERVVAGKVEVGMTGAKMDEEKCEYQPILEDSLVLITPNTPEYDKKDGYTIDELRRLPFIIREVGSGTRKETEDFLAKKGISAGHLHIVAQMSEQDAIKNAVRQGLGVSVMSRLAVDDFAEFKMIRVYPLQEGEILRKLYLVYRKNRPLTAAAEAFVRYVREKV